jgi:hypothetical protein
MFKIWNSFDMKLFDILIKINDLLKFLIISLSQIEPEE